MKVTDYNFDKTRIRGRLCSLLKKERVDKFLFYELILETASERAEFVMDSFITVGADEVTALFRNLYWTVTPQ